MSENEKSTIPGEPISEEQLDAVAGGSPKYGTVANPKHHKLCWFRSAGVWREDGRTKCMSECKGILSDGRPVPFGESGLDDICSWYICPCWGSDCCIDKWHKPCGRPPRTNW